MTTIRIPPDILGTYGHHPTVDLAHEGAYVIHNGVTIYLSDLVNTNIMYKGKVLELEAKLAKVEAVLADFLILGDKGGQPNDHDR